MHDIIIINSCLVMWVGTNLMDKCVYLGGLRLNVKDNLTTNFTNIRYLYAYKISTGLLIFAVY